MPRARGSARQAAAQARLDVFQDDLRAIRVAHEVLSRAASLRAAEAAEAAIFEIRARGEAFRLSVLNRAQLEMTREFVAQIERRWNKSPLPFDGREKRGAVTPVNALLNFGYTLLTNELNGLLEAAGLDPAAGFFHQPDGDRPSLACDWVEEFRHVIVDRFVLRLINQKMIGAGDFDDLTERGLRLKPEAVRRYLTAWEKALLGKNEAADSDIAPAWRGVFLAQLARLLKSLSAPGPYRTHFESD